MPRWLEARSAILCTVILGVWLGAWRSTGVSVSAAQVVRRPVAVVALSDDAEAESYANLIGTTLVHHDALAPLEPGSMIGALVGEFLDESRDKLASANGTRVRAEAALAGFVFPVAIATAQVGHESLHTVEPRTHSVSLYADLALILAMAKLGEGNPTEAAWYFGLVHQLTPGRRLDPALHLPTVVQAFEAARAGKRRPGKLVIQGSGNVWIDGHDLGAAARSIELPEGLHVVWLTGFERETVGKQVYVQPDQETVLDLGAAPAPLRLKVQRARVQLSNAPDPAARAVAMRRLAELLSVHDAVVITKQSNGKLSVQTWHDKPEGELQAGFSAPRLADGETPVDILRSLAPPPKRFADGWPRVRRVLEPPWYRRRGVQASIAAGFVGVVVGSVLLARSLDDGQVGLGRDVVFLPPKMAGQ